MQRAGRLGCDSSGTVTLIIGPSVDGRLAASIAVLRSSSRSAIRTGRRRRQRPHHHVGAGGQRRRVALASGAGAGACTLLRTTAPPTALETTNPARADGERLNVGPGRIVFVLQLCGNAGARRDRLGRHADHP